MNDAWAEAEANLPAGWVIDGLRRLYDYGRPNGQWIARATNPTEQRVGFMALMVGEGPSPCDALRSLSDRLCEKVPA